MAKMINGLISRLTYGQIDTLSDRKTDGQDGQNKWTNIMLIELR